MLDIPWQLLDTERHSVPRSLFTNTLVAHTVSETPIIIALIFSLFLRCSAHICTYPLFFQLQLHEILSIISLVSAAIDQNTYVHYCARSPHKLHDYILWAFGACSESYQLRQNFITRAHVHLRRTSVFRTSASLLHMYT